MLPCSHAAMQSCSHGRSATVPPVESECCKSTVTLYNNYKSEQRAISHSCPALHDGTLDDSLRAPPSLPPLFLLSRLHFTHNPPSLLPLFLSLNPRRPHLIPQHVHSRLQLVIHRGHPRPRILPTPEPVLSLLNGVCTLKYLGGYDSTQTLPSPTRPLALFLYSGGYWATPRELRPRSQSLQLFRRR